MNILTTNGSCGRFVTDWAGPEALVAQRRHPAGRAQLPGRHHDPHAAGRASRSGRGRSVTVSVRGRNGLGDHVTGTVELVAAATERLTPVTRAADRAARPRSPASAPPSSPRTPDAASCSWRSRRSRPALDDAGLARGRRRHGRPSPWTTTPRSRSHRTAGRRRPALLLPHPLRRRRRLRHRPAGRHGRRHRRRRRRGLLPRHERALAAALRHRRAGPAAAARSPEAVALRLALPLRAADAGLLGGDVRAALHARVRRHQRGLRPRRRSPTASTPRPTRRPGSTASRSRSRTTRHRAGSWSRCGCSTAARRATARVAVVVTTAERARDLRQPPVRDRGRGPGCQHRPADDDAATTATTSRACPRWGWSRDQLYADRRHRPGDIQTAVLYDHFTPFVLVQLEEFGFCGRGEAQGLHRATATSSSAAGCPINTHGGQLGEAYIHGMNGIAEGVRQMRGTRGQPGGRRRARAGHRRHRRPHQRADPAADS